MGRINKNKTEYRKYYLKELLNILLALMQDQYDELEIGEYIEGDTYHLTIEDLEDEQTIIDLGLDLARFHSKFPHY